MRPILRLAVFAGAFLLVFSSNAQQLEECLDLVKFNPDAALKMAVAPEMANVEGSWHCQGLALESLGKYVEAAKIYRDLSGETESPDLKLELALSAMRAYGLTGDPRALTAALSAQTLAAPEARPRVLALTAKLRLEKGDHEGARQDLFSALALDERDPTARFVLGHWLLAGDQVLQAEEVWSELAKDPVWKERAEQELLRFGH